jgi:hypothetical protein
VIDWLDESCKAWGRRTRWIVASSNRFGDPEGFPTATTIARVCDGISFGAGSARNWPEVRVGDALIIARALALEPHMPLVLTVHIWAQYVIEGRARHKLPGLSRYLGQIISVAEYWRNIDRAHHFLAGRLPGKPREPLILVQVPDGQRDPC